MLMLDNNLWPAPGVTRSYISNQNAAGSRVLGPSDGDIIPASHFKCRCSAGARRVGDLTSPMVRWSLPFSVEPN